MSSIHKLIRKLQWSMIKTGVSIAMEGIVYHWAIGLP